MSVQRRGVLATPVAALTSLLLVVVAWAVWTSGADASADSAFSSTGVGAGETPTAVVSAQAVTVDWAASMLSDGDPVDGYEVARYDAGTLALQSVGAACAGVVTATICVEASVPAGDWVYSVTPVHASTWRGAESANSNPVTVVHADATAPTNSVTVQVLSGNAAMTGSTIHYRGLAAGSLTLTNAVSDAESGAASSTTGALGNIPTSWTHVPSTVSTPAGGPYVSNVFSWTAGATSSPTVVVTGRDVAGNTTPVTVTFVNDSTAPSAGTVSAPAGYQPGLSVPVTFTSGTDGGSGIATRQLQRRSAPLTPADTCVTWTGFANTGPANPTSVHTDTTVSNGTCYEYEYVVTDRVGNTHTATSATVSIVDYAGAVGTTTGALSHWRLGEASSSLSSTDSLTGTAASALTSHVGEIGATWTNLAQSGSVNTEKMSSENRAFRSGTGMSINYASATPPTPDYSVEADLYYRATLANDSVGVITRLNSGLQNYYQAHWYQGLWRIGEVTGGTQTQRAVSAAQPALVVGQTYRLRLDVSGSASTVLTLYVNGVQVSTYTDLSPITAAGKGGIIDGYDTSPESSATKSDTVGLHFDNFQITPSTYPRAADSKGTNTGDHKNGVVLGAAGAVTGDADTAAQFDGVNDYVQVIGSAGLPTGAGARSVEAWFKTSSPTRQVLFSYGSLVSTQEYGLVIEPSGTTMYAWGFGGINDKTFTMPSAVNDGQWHQVVQTFSGASFTLYIDGVALPAQAATRNTVMDVYGFGIGAVINPSDGPNSGGFFNGSIDEVSFYTSVLSPTTVTSHYQLGISNSADMAGPTGGSVVASGLLGTGSRYAASATLSLDLAKGSDPSGVAATGATLQRSTGTLTSDGTGDGVCSAFGGYTLVSGGTDPATPKTDTVADQACYRYQYLVPDTLGNYRAYTSADIRVDLTAPAAPSLSFGGFTNTYWSSGGTVYYRSAAATGSFTATSTASDPRSGVASHAFPTLGTNWASTPGALGVNTYSWSGAPQVPGAKTVTATNHAARVSGTTTFTPTADDTAPSAGTVTYPNATQTSTTISVGYTTGTDAGSGIATRLLQRQSAPLTGGTSCGTYGGYTTISGGTNPASSPVADLAASENCYQYRYVVTDQVGNAHTATSSNVVKVTSGTSYSDAVSATPGLLNYYRLGETTISSDTFTGTNGTLLTAHTGEIGATWVHLNGTANTILTGNRARRNGAQYSREYTSTAPPSADYSVEVDFRKMSTLANDNVGVMARLNTATSTFYSGEYYDNGDGTVNYGIGQYTNGTWAGDVVLPYSANNPLAVGATVRMRLEVSGGATTTLKLYINGVLILSGTDTSSPITAAGFAGVMDGDPGNATTKSATTGAHWDNFVVTPRAADSLGGGTGWYLDGPTLGQPGASFGDPNTAALFDGSTDHVRTAAQSLSSFSTEFWFASTQGIGTGTAWKSGAALVDSSRTATAADWGISLRSDGKLLAGAGNSDVTIVGAVGGFNDGAWHHVVFTRNSTTGAMVLYVDGSSANGGSATGATGARHNYDITFGRQAEDLSHAYLGYLDEVAIYNTVLSGATVSAHYAAR